MPLSASEIADTIETAASDSNTFNGKGLTPLFKDSTRVATSAIKLFFGDLGRQQGFRIAAAGYVHADEGEWLYDMVWYEQDSAGLMSRLPMVLESEWKFGVLVDKNVEVDGDFQKLVQARADVRVWVSSSPNSDMAKLHIENCKKQARLFLGGLSGDIYVFIIHEWTTPTTLIERFVLP